ncbi:VOC family protein [Salinivibrio sp. IB574]|uniref:VOC family protein n=1 Tax=Salinivibrio sp. IB574 TaxID=1909444 RepID=UPI001F5162DE|nr:VOC family protein [Salinivibrio sp. IB574]
MMTTIEHVNITVVDMDAALAFLAVAVPDFKIRQDAQSPKGYRWVHVGNEHCYFALQEPNPSSEPSIQPRSAYKSQGVNHIGLIIDDIDTIRERLLEKGYQPNGSMAHETHRKRMYFYDKAGFEWELVAYSSDKAEERYLYE